MECLSAAQREHRRLLWYKRHRRRPTRPALSESHRRYLEEAGAFLALPRSTTDALLPIYTSLLDDLIPILDGSSVLRDYSNGQASPYLVKAMCLVACKTKQAGPYLRLSEDSAPLGPLEFASKMLEGLDAAIKADLEPDRVIRIQVLALMHLHNDGTAGRDRSSHCLSQAISEAWSMPLHWDIPGNSDQTQCDMLWWSLRNLDRLNKPIMGAAPFIIDDSDIAIGRILPRPDNYRSQLMAVALALGDLMATATKVYKGSSKTKVDECHSFPTLSEVISSTNFSRFHRWHREYLETWYHVAAMLSCRFSGPGSVQYSRRLASADRILEIICHGGHEHLPPLPLVPYAMSMSTTITYRALRDGQRAVDLACKDLRLCCESLNALGYLWTSARGFAKLATRLWRVLTASSFPHKQLRPPNFQAEGTRVVGTDGAATVQRPDDACAQGTEEGRVEVDGVSPLTAPAPSIFPLGQPIAGEQAPELSGSFNGQLVEGCAGVDDAYYKLDMAFYDLFDYGLPNVLRDSSAWDVLHVRSDEDGFLGTEYAVISPNWDSNAII